MKIVKLKYDKNPAWCNIFVDTGEFLKISTDIVLKYKLATGIDIDEDVFEALSSEQSKINIRQAAYSFAAYKSRTMRQVIDKLKRGGYSGDEIADAIEFLNNFALIDDQKFAGAFVRDYLLRKQVSKDKLKSELIRKGISSFLAIQAIEENYPKENEYDYALKCAQKRMIKIRNKPAPKQKPALASYLRIQGYDADIIKYVIEDIFANSDSDLID